MEVIGIIFVLAFASSLFFGFRTGKMPIKSPLREPSRYQTPVYFWSVAAFYGAGLMLGASMIISG
ncbi:hypothetical protein [Sphingobium vermicomposti]|uniref:Uncharacterized protein n=1 Tax=Sphingobium vermicomposti TaxID=529005 RepID=A0A846MH34_9SPHN|nr:hypothetical protein [Sphingobium vermicomposti]NIJ17985.1 hypothetical protein [Sphingobium vermicomposti]